MSEKEYLIMLDADVRKRYYHFIKAGEIKKFVVQLEVKISDLCETVIRYDCAHDYAHKDCYNSKGECKKINLYLSYEEALIFTNEDINENWEIYKEKFLEGRFP